MWCNDNDNDDADNCDDGKGISAATAAAADADGVEEMTTTMMPATMMGRRGRKSVRRYKRKDNFGNCGEGESVFDGDCLKPKKFIPNLPYVASRANKRQHTLPHAYWE